MFIKLPSGRIFRLEHIVYVRWNSAGELNVKTVEDGESWTLDKEDGQCLYDYLDSISIQKQ